jgi:6-pyruvoyltetrahydropterin/6-carboxytetrahydropterin synthase
MYELIIRRNFAAAHSLRGYHGQCESLHGHNWKVEVFVVANELDEIGLAVDFRVLKDKTDEILKNLDHQHLNELPYFRDLNPSSENIAKYIFDQLSRALNDERIKVAKVSTWESEDSCSSYLFP